MSDSSPPYSGCTPPAGTAIAFYSAQDYNPEESIGYLMRRVLAMVAQEVERQLVSSDLTNAQWVPLFKLSIGKASTVAELARECHLDGGATTRLLDRLEAKGLCRRVRSVSDRRVVNIELTPAGQVAAAGIPEVLSQVQNTHLAGFSVEEFETLKSFLRRILGNQQTSHPPSPPDQAMTGATHDA
jgi:DNA-binding MarR family transcriptional regulator